MIEQPKRKMHLGYIDSNFYFLYDFLNHLILKIVLLRMWSQLIKLMSNLCHILTVPYEFLVCIYNLWLLKNITNRIKTYKLNIDKQW